jgi:hypothetical protein
MSFSGLPALLNARPMKYEINFIGVALQPLKMGFNWGMVVLRP